MPRSCSPTSSSFPHALGQNVRFVEGEGPRLDPITSTADLSDAARRRSTSSASSPVFETIERVRAELPSETTLLGFCGAPWTVASYMIAGKGTPDLAPARAARLPRSGLHAGADRPARRGVHRLSRAPVRSRRRRGADLRELRGRALTACRSSSAGRSTPIRRIVGGRAGAQVPRRKIIVFARGAGATAIASRAPRPAPTPSALDWAVDRAWACRAGPSRKPRCRAISIRCSLVAGGAPLDGGVDPILAAFAGGPHIFNLGHGIMPETPIAACRAA